MSLTVNHQAWLPPTALNDGRLLAGLSEALQAWGVEWMGASRAKHLSVVENRSDILNFDSSYFLQGGPGLSIKASGRDALAENLLAMSFDELSANTADKNFLRGLVENAIGDALTKLSDRSDEMQKGLVKANWAFQFTVSFDESVLFQIALPRTVAIEWRKSLAPAIGSEVIEFGEIRTAISNKVVKLDAVVGSLSFDINKVSNLKVGDVISLDRAVNESFPLRANGNDCEGIQARFIVTQTKKRAPRQPNIILEYCNE